MIVKDIKTGAASGTIGLRQIVCRKLLVVFTGCIPPDLEHIMAKECPS